MTGTATAELCTAIEKWSRDFEPRLLDGTGAQRALRKVTRMKAMCAAVEAGLARRVEETNVWQRGGHKTPAHSIAATTGTSIGEAARVLKTAEQLDELPHTSEAFRTGRVTQAQVREIASAAVTAPERERALLATAKDRPHACLRDHAARVRAHGRDEAERHRRAHGQRGLRTYTDLEGIWHLHAQGTPTDGARIKARLDVETDLVFTEARKAGVRDAREAYAFDALVRTCEARGSEHDPPKAHVFVNVDADRLTGTSTDPGGRCEIKGVGPVPVETARAYLDDALLTILVKKGVDVTTIAHDGTKTMPASVRRAVLARDQECVVASCSAAATQIHHLEYRSRGGRHSVGNCRGICDWCHDLVHYHHYTLEPDDDGTCNLRAPP